MTFSLIFGLSIVALALAGFIRTKIWESNGRIINAEWLNDEDRFKLITRWGLHS